MATPHSNDVALRLSENDYLRQRINPRPGDPLYLHLADLHRGLNLHGTEQPLLLLDYGCGGSPYRSFFPNATYHRADYSCTPSVDFTLEANGLLPAISDGSYDMVLSTQVLEHVSDPHCYLAESHRVLRRGGKLILTTHGTFPDHGCPHDYWRWTADGLKLSLERAGFKVTRISKLTCGIRAVLFWLGQAFHVPPRRSLRPASLALRLASRLVRNHRALLDGLAGKFTEPFSLREDHSPEPVDFYVALIAEGIRSD